MPAIGAALKAGWAGLKGAAWGKIGEEAWGAVSKDFSKRALTGAAVGAVGGAAKGAIVDYGEQGRPLFSSIAANALKGGVAGGLAFGVGGGLLGKGGKGFRTEFNKAFNGFRSTVGKGTAAAAAGGKEAAALEKPIEAAAGATPAAAPQKYKSINQIKKETGSPKTQYKSVNDIRREASAKSFVKNSRRAQTDRTINPMREELQRKLGNDFNVIHGSAGTGSAMGGARGISGGLSYTRPPGFFGRMAQRASGVLRGWGGRVGFRM